MKHPTRFPSLPVIIGAVMNKPLHIIYGVL
jgi:hypothetical protein